VVRGPHFRYREGYQFKEQRVISHYPFLSIGGILLLTVPRFKYFQVESLTPVIMTDNIFDYAKYDEVNRILTCIEHKSSISLTHPDNHENGVTVSIRKRIDEYAKRLSLSPFVTGSVPGNQFTSPISRLKVHEGIICTEGMCGTVAISTKNHGGPLSFGSRVRQLRD
jgi:hypothetical protein